MFNPLKIINPEKNEGHNKTRRKNLRCCNVTASAPTAQELLPSAQSRISKNRQQPRREVFNNKWIASVNCS
jgi:hypothetical protein